MNEALPLAIDRVPIGSDVAGLSLAARAWPAMERPGQLTGLAGLIESGQADTMVLLVARRGERLCGAVLAQVLAGRTAVVWPPQIAGGDVASGGAALLAELERHLRQAGVFFSQAVLEATRRSGADLLRSAGFVPAGELSYMAADAATFPSDPPPLPFKVVESGSVPPERLLSVVERTYRGSLDCPLVDGLRPVADALAGYRAVGQHRPDWWLIALNDGAIDEGALDEGALDERAIGKDQDIGCLLMADHPADEQLEIVYLGIAPECRGRGFGLALTRHAQWLALAAGRARVVLAVDAANRPAIAAYEAAGFIAWDRRLVLIRDFRGGEKPVAPTT